MSEQNYLKFFSKSREGKVLSNFAPIEVEINRVKYKTGEHAFHGEKYRNLAEMYDHTDKRYQVLKKYSKKFRGETFETPGEAKKGGGKQGMMLNPDEIEEWNVLSYDIQRKISEYKFENNEEVRKVIEESDDRYLLHQENRARPTNIWGGKVCKKTGEIIGKNKLGEIWMEIRKTNPI